MQQALIANTVRREDLINAYATNVITITSTRITGPFLGGVLIHELGFVTNFAIEAGLYAGVVLMLLTMKTPYGNLATASNQSPLSNMAEGVRYIRRDQRVILNLMVLGLVPNVILHPLWLMLPIFTSDVLHKGADFGGYLLSATGFGGLVSTIVIASVGFIFRKGMVCLVSAIASSICVILFSQSTWLVPSFMIIALMAFSQAYFRTSNGTLIQILAPDALQRAHRTVRLVHYAVNRLHSSRLCRPGAGGLLHVHVPSDSCAGVGLLLAGRRCPVSCDAPNPAFRIVLTEGN